MECRFYNTQAFEDMHIFLQRLERAGSAETLLFLQKSGTRKPGFVGSQGNCGTDCRSEVGRASEREARGAATFEENAVFSSRVQNVREGTGEPRCELAYAESAKSILNVYGCLLAPRTFTDARPTVLVLRSVETATSENIRVLVHTRALLDRCAREVKDAKRALKIPPMTVSAAWASVLPPRSGWEPMGVVDPQSLLDVAEQIRLRIAREKIDLPASEHEELFARVCTQEIFPQVPAGAAYAGAAVGFFQTGEAVHCLRTKNWIRLKTRQGQVLVRLPILNTKQ